MPQEEGPTARDVTFGHFDPPAGSRIVCRFDFGDDWRFEIVVTDRRNSAARLLQPLLTGAHGQAPRQYGW